MPLTITSPNPVASLPVEISITIDDSDNLQFSCNGKQLRENEGVFVKHLRESRDAPVDVPVTIFAPSKDCTVEAEHVDNTGTRKVWNGGDSRCCKFTWAATEREYEIVVKVSQPTANGKSVKIKSVYFKVRPEPDAPWP